MFAPRINYIAIVTCVVFQFIFGLIWYSPWVFNDYWFSLARLDLETVEALGIQPYLMSIVSLIAATYALAWIIITTHSTNAKSGAKIGFYMWLGFLAPAVFAGNAFKGFDIELSVIESSADLINFLVAGAVLGSWKRRR